MRIGIIIGVAIVVLALVVCLVPLKEVAYGVTVDYDDTETYYENESLEYRQLDSFTTEAIDDVRGRATMVGYDLPDEIVAWPAFAVYVVVQNLDDAPGVFEVRYTCVGTADRSVAEDRQLWVQSTPEEYQELLDINCYTGSAELHLQPLEVGVAICPQGGVNVGSDRVAWWSGGYDVIPGTQAVEKQRTVTKQRQETRYKKVTLLDYLLHY
jgi:hypothetical protein